MFPLAGAVADALVAAAVLDGVVARLEELEELQAATSSVPAAAAARDAKRQ